MGVRVREKFSGSGDYWVFVNYKKKRRAWRIGSERAANLFAEKIEAGLKLGKSFLPDEKPLSPTLEEYYGKFKRTHLAIAVRESTQASYNTSFRNHLLPELGKLGLDQITRPRVRNFVSLLVEKNLSKSTIRIILACLSKIMNEAKEDGHVTDNPASHLGKFYKQARVVHEEVQPLSREEVPIFLESVAKNAPYHFAFFLAAVHTGARGGELAALQWGDIDWKGKFVVVRRNFVRGKVGKTKTARIRRVDLSDALLLQLKALKENRTKEYAMRGRKDIPDWIFCNQQGKPLDLQNVKNRFFKKCLKKAGLRQIRFHDLRHTFASLLIQDGQSLAYVKEQLGHSSIKLTVDVYGHLVPGANREAVNRLPTIKEPNLQTLVFKRAKR